MKLIVAGGRNYELTGTDRLVLDMLHKEYIVSELVHGGAKGADRCGKEWAEGNGIQHTVFNAPWASYGIAAGPIRNKQMAEYADAVVLFPGGKGTNSMYKEAKKAGIVIFDFRSGDHNG